MEGTENQRILHGKQLRTDTVSVPQQIADNSGVQHTAFDGQVWHGYSIVWGGRWYVERDTQMWTATPGGTLGNAPAE